MFEQSLYLGFLISVSSYELGRMLNKRYNYAIINPLLIAISLCIIILSIFGIDYDTYNQSAKYISYLLTPATIALAIPLYEKAQIIKSNLKAVFVAIIAGCISSMTSIAMLCMLFGFSNSQMLSLLPKSVTTAIGIGIASEIGGNINLCVAAIVLTGIMGNIIAIPICKLLKLKSPIAKGLAIGTSSHAIGTARAMQMGDIEGATSSLALVISGLISVILAPIVVQFI